MDGRRTVADLLMEATDGLSEEDAGTLEQAVLTTLRSLAELGIVTFDVA